MRASKTILASEMISSKTILETNCTPLTLEVPQNQNFGLHMFGHNSLADRAREMFKPFKNAVSLVVSIFLKMWSFGMELFWGWRHNCGMLRVFWIMSSQSEKNSRINFFLSKKIKRKFASLVLDWPSIALVPVVGTLWPKNNKLINLYPKPRVVTNWLVITVEY